MRKVKHCIVLLAMLLLSVLLVSCAEQNVVVDTQNETIYQSDNVKVTELSDLKEKRFNQYEWIDMSEDTAYSKNPIIFTGSVNDVTQAKVEYEFMGVDVEDNITILDVNVEEVIFNSASFEFSDTVSVGVPYNNSTYGEGLPNIEDGKTFLMFVYPTSDKEKDSLELANYVDLWLSSPNQLLIEEVDGSYIVGTLFADYFKKSDTVVEQLGLSTEEIEQYSDYRHERNDAKFYEFDDRTDEIMQIMSERVDPEHSILGELLSSSYIVDKADLEKIIYESAVMYNGD